MTIGDKVTTPWIRRFKPTDIGYVRLVCFPHAGGSASYFNPVSARFSPGVDVVALQYPGRQDRRNEPCVTDLGILADLFPHRKIVGIHAVDLVWGLGTLHCLTQQQPSGRSREPSGTAESAS